MGNGKWGTGNGKREMGNGERETGNGEREMGNGKWGTGNGEWRMRNGERGSLESSDRTRVLGVLKAERASPVLARCAREQP